MKLTRSDILAFVDVVLGLKCLGLFLPFIFWGCFGDALRTFLRRYEVRTWRWAVFPRWLDQRSRKGRKGLYHRTCLPFFKIWDDLVLPYWYPRASSYLAHLTLRQAHTTWVDTSIDQTFKTLRTRRRLVAWREWVTLSLTQLSASFLGVGLYAVVRLVRQSLQAGLAIIRRSFGEGWLYLQGMGLALFIDACLTDDEPLWEPVEWSLVQSWIMFIFLFAWIAENLISSRYGSYTGRDKRVWFAWYKTFWLIEGWYLISLGAASLWVMIPHYYELNYLVSYIVAWWDWYNREFFSTLLSIYTIILYLAYDLLLKVRWVNWRKALLTILLINLFLAYLLYVQFFIAFFSYFTGNNWYRKVRLVDYIQMSHEPHRWGYGLGAKSDHFLTHYTKNKFWFKNDGPFAGLFLFISLFLVLALFFLNFFWLSLARRVYATREVSFTYTVYCVSALRQFFYFLGFFALFVFISYGFIFWRLPVEFYWQSAPLATVTAIFDLFRQVFMDGYGYLEQTRTGWRNFIWSFIL